MQSELGLDLIQQLFHKNYLFISLVFKNILIIYQIAPACTGQYEANVRPLSLSKMPLN